MGIFFFFDFPSYVMPMNLASDVCSSSVSFSICHSDIEARNMPQIARGRCHLIHQPPNDDFEEEPVAGSWSNESTYARGEWVRSILVGAWPTTAKVYTEKRASTCVLKGI